MPIFKGYILVRSVVPCPLGTWTHKALSTDNVVQLIFHFIITTVVAAP